MVLSSMLQKTLAAIKPLVMKSLGLELEKLQIQQLQKNGASLTPD